MINAAETSRVLVTGGAGFIGSWLVERLLTRGFKVRVLDDLSTGRRENLSGAAELQVGNVLDREVFERALHGVDGVIHLAGVVGMRLAEARREYAYAVATESTKNLFALFSGPVVLASSSAVYGLTGDAPVSEQSPVTEEDALRYDGGRPGYALGKWRMDKMAAEAAAAGQKVLTIRPFNVVGPRQTGHYGMVVPTFIHAAMAGEALQVHDDGEQTRCFGHVSTFVDVVLDLAAQQASWRPDCRIVNVGNEIPVSILELARIVLEETGQEAPLRFVPYSKVFPGRTDVRNRRPDCTRLFQLLDGRPAWPSIRAVVRDILSTYQCAVPA